MRWIAGHVPDAPLYIVEHEGLEPAFLASKWCASNAVKESGRRAASASRIGTRQTGAVQNQCLLFLVKGSIVGGLKAAILWISIKAFTRDKNFVEDVTISYNR